MRWARGDRRNVDDRRGSSGVGMRAGGVGLGGLLIVPRFTHGSSEQRVSWFRRGFERGDPQACETFQ